MHLHLYVYTFPCDNVTHALEKKNITK